MKRHAVRIASSPIPFAKDCKDSTIPIRFSVHYLNPTSSTATQHSSADLSNFDLESLRLNVFGKAGIISISLAIGNARHPTYHRRFQGGFENDGQHGRKRQRSWL